jgi:hypothetical protein
LKKAKSNKENFCRRLLIKNKEEGLFYYNYKRKRERWNKQKIIIIKKFKKEKEKEDKNCKISKKVQGFSEYKKIRLINNFI